MSIEIEIARKNARKARLGERPRWINFPRNWLHQAVSYMDAGELLFRLVIELTEIMAVWALLAIIAPGLNCYLVGSLAFVIIHTWNWVTNGLFWSVFIFTFPGLKNPGAQKTVVYLNAMRDRLSCSKCISGIAIYGSVTRQAWHDRSDIDIRFLRHKGVWNLIRAGLQTMAERFRAFLARQPMDLYLADDVDFLMKMRSDEVPLLTLCRDDRLQSLYIGCHERTVELSDLLGSRSSG